MEPTNHPFGKEHDLPNLHEDMFQPLIFRGVLCLYTGFPPGSSTASFPLKSYQNPKKSEPSNILQMLCEPGCLGIQGIILPSHTKIIPSQYEDSHEPISTMRYQPRVLHVVQMFKQWRRSTLLLHEAWTLLFWFCTIANELPGEHQLKSFFLVGTKKKYVLPLDPKTMKHEGFRPSKYGS